jgi:hypothetical protein
MIYVVKVWIENGCLWAETDKGTIAKYELSRFEGLRHATEKQLQSFVIQDKKNISWPELDEEINLEGMFYDNGFCQLTPTEDSVCFRPIPETCDYVAENSNR